MAYVCKLPAITPSQDLYRLSSHNLTRSIDFYMDVTNDSLGGREVPGFKVVLTFEEEKPFALHLLHIGGMGAGGRFELKHGSRGKPSWKRA